MHCNWGYCRSAFGGDFSDLLVKEMGRLNLQGWSPGSYSQPVWCERQCRHAEGHHTVKTICIRAQDFVLDFESFFAFTNIASGTTRCRTLSPVQELRTGLAIWRHSHLFPVAFQGTADQNPIWPKSVFPHTKKKAYYVTDIISLRIVDFEVLFLALF